MPGSPGDPVTVGGINSSSGAPVFIPGWTVLSSAHPWGWAVPRDGAAWREEGLLCNELFRAGASYFYRARSDCEL